MDLRALLPWLGDREAREAWDELFSREMLGAVVLGSATGKLVENLIALAVLLVFGPDSPAIMETVGFIAAWSLALPVGAWVFAYWHKFEGSKDAVEEAAEAAAETAEEAADEVTDTDE